MPENTGETDVLNYLVRTGPISLADLALRFNDPPKVLRALNELREREEVNLDQTGVLDQIIQRINQFPADAIVQESFNLLRDAPEAKSIVRLTDRGFKKAFG